MPGWSGQLSLRINPGRDMRADAARPAFPASIIGEREIKAAGWRRSSARASRLVPGAVCSRRAGLACRRPGDGAGSGFERRGREESVSSNTENKQGGKRARQARQATSGGIRGGASRCPVRSMTGGAARRTMASITCGGNSAGRDTEQLDRGAANLRNPDHRPPGRDLPDRRCFADGWDRSAGPSTAASSTKPSRSIWSEPDSSFVRTEGRRLSLSGFIIGKE